MKKLTFLLLIISFITMSSSLAATNGGYAGAFLRMGLGADAISQGDAYTARAANGFAAYYNPAGLTFLKERTIATSYSSLALDRSVNFIGLSFPLKPTAGLAVGWVNAGVTNIDGRDYDGNHYDYLSFYDNAFTFAFSNRFSDYVAAGVGVKILYGMYPEALEDDKALTASGVGFDFGLMVRPVKQVSIGLQIRDINSKYGWDSSEFYSEGTSKNDKFPRIYKLGAAFFPNEEIAFEYDFELSDKEAIEHHIGLEYIIPYKPGYNFMMRTGYDNDSPTFGFGFNFKIGDFKSRLDMAYILEEIAPDDTMIFSWTFLY